MHFGKRNAVCHSPAPERKCSTPAVAGERVSLLLPSGQRLRATVIDFLGEGALIEVDSVLGVPSTFIVLTSDGRRRTAKSAPHGARRLFVTFF